METSEERRQRQHNDSLTIIEWVAIGGAGVLIVAICYSIIAAIYFT